MWMGSTVGVPEKLPTAIGLGRTLRSEGVAEGMIPLKVRTTVVIDAHPPIQRLEPIRLDFGTDQ